MGILTHETRKKCESRAWQNEPLMLATAPSAAKVSNADWWWWWGVMMDEV